MKFLKWIIIIFALIVGAFFINYFYFPKSPKDTVSYSKEELNLSITYSRPSVNERNIFGTADEGALVPYGKYWRLGADASTNFTTNKNISFAGNELTAGTYRMYVIPEENNWTIYLNTEPTLFGVKEPDHSKDVLSITLPVIKLFQPVEQLTIEFVDNSIGLAIKMSWDNTLISVPIN